MSVLCRDEEQFFAEIKTYKCNQNVNNWWRVVVFRRKPVKKPEKEAERV